MATPLNARQQALCGYFWTVATDPRVLAAGLNLTKFRRAVLSCVEEDLPAVMKFAATRGLEVAAEPVAGATRDVARTALGGVVSDEVAGHAAAAAGAAVRDGARRVGAWIEGLGKKKR